MLTNFRCISTACLILLLPTVVLAQIPKKTPRFLLTSDDGNSELEIQLTVQARWDGTRIDEGETSTGTFELYLRRIRPVLAAKLLGGDLSLLLHLNIVPGAMELMDIYGDYAFSSKVRLRVGQMKIPFTRWRLNSFKDRPTLDWSYPSKYFGAERQLGVMLHNGVSASPEWEYQIGVFDGVNSRASHGVGMPLIYGLDRPNASSLDDPSPLENLHAEVVAHVAYNARGIDVRYPTDFAGGGLRWSTGMSVAWDIEPTPGQDMRLRIAPEVAVAVGGFGGTAVGYLGFYDPTQRAGSHVFGLWGGLVQLSYLFEQRYELAVKYSTVRVLSGLREDAQSRARARLGAGEDIGAIGQTAAENELNLNLNVYVLGSTLKLQVEGALLLHERDSDNRYDMAVRTQMQLAF